MFKTGDRLLCVDDFKTTKVKKGQVYTAVMYPDEEGNPSKEFIYLDIYPGSGFFCSRFVLAYNEEYLVDETAPLPFFGEKNV